MKNFLGCDANSQPYAQLCAIPSFEDQRGQLLPYDFQVLPFIPERIFVVRSVPIGTVRGCHSHKRQRQFITCLSGAIEIHLKIGEKSASIHLDNPCFGLLIEPGVWASQTFMQENTVEMVMANGPYDPQEYLTES